MNGKNNVLSHDIPLERKIIRITLDGFQFLSSTIIGYANDWNLERDIGWFSSGYGINTCLCLFDQCVQSADASPISRRHAIDFVHDETRLVSDGDIKRIRRLAYQSFSFVPTLERRVPLFRPSTHLTTYY